MQTVPVKLNETAVDVPQLNMYNNNYNKVCIQYTR